MAEICEVPIFKTSKLVTLTTTPQTLADMGIEIDPEAVQIKIIFEGLWQLKPIARFARDPLAVITANNGNPIYPNKKVCLNEFSLLALFRSVSGEATALVQQFTAIPECDFTEQYIAILPQILPVGFAWVAKCDPESNLFKLLNVFAKMFSDFHCRTLDLINEMFAGTCRELCDRHQNERFDRQLDECLNRFSLTQAQTIKALVAKIVSAGAFRVEDFIAIAAALTLEVQVDDDALNFTQTFDFINTNLVTKTACINPCEPILDGSDMNLILAFICIMDKIGSAQTKRRFTVDGKCEIGI